MPNTDKKKKLHYHSDCDFFGGSERLMPLLWNSESIQNSFNISFSYRSSERYNVELIDHLPSHIAAYPIRLRLPSNRDASPSRLNFRKKFIVNSQKFKDTLFFYPNFLRDVLKMRAILREVKPDILHLNNGGFPGARSVRAAAVAARLESCPKVIMTVNNIAYPYTSLRRIYEYPIDRLIRHSTHIFTTASGTASEALRQTLQLDSTEIRQIPNSVAIPNPSTHPRKVRSDLGADEGSLVIGLVGVLEERKGHEILFRAVRRALDEDVKLHDQVRVWLIGSGTLDSPLRTRVKELGLQKHVEFLGYRHDHLEFMNAMDLIIQPSLHHEDSPLATIQAMALGKPIIASRLAGLEEQVVDGQTGILVEPGDIYQLSTALLELAHNENKRIEFGGLGYKRYQSEYDLESFVQSYTNLYQQQNGDCM